MPNGAGKKISSRACSSVMPVSLTKRRTTISGLFGALSCSSAILVSEFTDHGHVDSEALDWLVRK
jgi:hypothetical protein